MTHPDFQRRGLGTGLTNVSIQLQIALALKLLQKHGQVQLNFFQKYEYMILEILQFEVEDLIKNRKTPTNILKRNPAKNENAYMKNENNEQHLFQTWCFLTNRGVKNLYLDSNMRPLFELAHVISNTRGCVIREGVTWKYGDQLRNYELMRRKDVIF
ncbi:hypothetical protein BofuT4_P144340.1 [Botrytis cinerea T4]|uniref:Uncharacterized protein n=1 Tax=Botryotinia fuckeliana (strain T4) TaxID=999810 RepID=G2YYC8_BOTF4|nr:hypothetical protein BofuT4_P144340.1 [Botrytis cinerea T4]